MSGREDCTYAHRDAAWRYRLLSAKAHCHLFSRYTADENQTGSGCDHRTRLIGCDVAAAPNTQKSDVQTTTIAYLLFIVQTLFMDMLLCHTTVGRKDMLFRDVDMIEQTVAKLSQTRDGRARMQREIVIDIKDDDIAKAKSIGLMASDKFLIDRGETLSCSQGQNAGIAC